jgi:hypothetical protein
MCIWKALSAPIGGLSCVETADETAALIDVMSW